MLRDKGKLPLRQIMPGFLGIKGGTLMDPDKLLPFIEVRPSSSGFDVCTYPWEESERAFDDAHMSLDQDGPVELRVVYMTQSEFDALQKEDEV